MPNTAPKSMEEIPQNQEKKLKAVPEEEPKVIVNWEAIEKGERLEDIKRQFSDLFEGLDEFSPQEQRGVLSTIENKIGERRGVLEVLEQKMSTSAEKILKKTESKIKDTSEEVGEMAKVEDLTEYLDTENLQEAQEELVQESQSIFNRFKNKMKEIGSKLFAKKEEKVKLEKDYERLSAKDKAIYDTLVSFYETESDQEKLTERAARYLRTETSQSPLSKKLSDYLSEIPWINEALEKLTEMEAGMEAKKFKEVIKEIEEVKEPSEVEDFVAGRSEKVIEEWLEFKDERERLQQEFAEAADKEDKERLYKELKVVNAGFSQAGKERVAMLDYLENKRRDLKKEINKAKGKKVAALEEVLKGMENSLLNLKEVKGEDMELSEDDFETVKEIPQEKMSAKEARRINKEIRKAEKDYKKLSPEDKAIFDTLVSFYEAGSPLNVYEEGEAGRLKAQGYLRSLLEEGTELSIDLKKYLLDLPWAAEVLREKGEVPRPTKELPLKEEKKELKLSQKEYKKLSKKDRAEYDTVMDLYAAKGKSSVKSYLRNNFSTREPMSRKLKDYLSKIDWLEETLQGVPVKRKRSRKKKTS